MQNFATKARKSDHRHPESPSIADTFVMDAGSADSERPPQEAPTPLLAAEGLLSVLGQGITVLRIAWVVLVMYLKLQSQTWFMRHRKPN